MRPLFWLAGCALLLLTAGFGYYFGKTSVTHIANSTSNQSDTTTANKILYYRNPMGLADTSPTPKKDSMGMDYIPVYENEIQQSNIVKIDTYKIQALGVQTQPVRQQLIGQEFRAFGNLEIDESRLTNISPKFEGTVTTLLVSTSGQQVAKGEILFEVQIPDLYYSELAYKQAVKKTFDDATATPDIRMQAELQLTAAMENLDYIGVPLDEIERLQRGGEPFSQISYRSPASGVVIEKNIVQGMRFTAGDRLYQLADLSKLWLIIQLPEQALAYIKTGDALRVAFLGEPGKYRKAKIDFIYPALESTNHSIKIRAEMDNSSNKLKLGQSAEVWLQSEQHKALVIPANALLDSGREQWVLVALGEGIYQPRSVKPGERSTDWIEVKEGLEENEQVVTNANFLIDSESRLQAALENFNSTKKSLPNTEHSHAMEHSHSNDTHRSMEH